MGKETDKKFYVEIKQSRRGHYYLGSLKVHADSIEEMENLIDSALSSVMYKIGLLNESRRKEEKLKTSKSLQLTDPVDKQLFEKLRQWRLKLSREKKVRPFMIFHDTTLKEIALRKPVTSEELYQISGIGPKKYEKYGVILLKIVNAFITNSRGKESENRNINENLYKEKILKMEEENDRSKVLLQGDKVKIQNQSKYSGEVGEIVGYDGYQYYEIELMSVKKIIKCLEKEIEKASDDDMENYEVEVKVDDKKILKLKAQNLKPSIEALKDNQVFRALYALGKYYSFRDYPETHKNDFLSQKIIELKSLNKKAAQEIAEVYLSFIEGVARIKRITDKIDYIVMMPTTKETNHVSLWGDKICEALNKKNLTKFIYINPEKVDYLKDYVHKDLWGRKLTAKGAFRIDKDKSSFPLLTNKTCLILDDVCTTGNQINALTNLLAEEGIREVYAFVIGKTKFS